MKKAISAVVLILVLAGAGAPFISGVITERTLKQVFNDINQMYSEAGSDISLEISRYDRNYASSQIEFVLRQREKDMIVNLINRSVDSDLHYHRGAQFIGVVPEADPFWIEIACRNLPSSVEIYPDMPNHEWKWKNGKVMINIPSIHIHAAVVLEDAL